jgi:hypothetical protein
MTWRHWTTREEAIVREHYPAGGTEACVPLLQGRTAGSVRSKARALGLRCSKPPTKGKRMPRLYRVTPEVDATIREAYLTARRKGDVKAKTAHLGYPLWWVHARAIELGLSRNVKARLDRWTERELDALRLYAPCGIKVIAREVSRVGQGRSPTACQVMLKRLHVDRSDPGAWSANALAELLGVNGNTVRDWIERFGMPAARVPEATGNRFRYSIRRRPLRDWISRNRHMVDLRTVDQEWFMSLAFDSEADPEVALRRAA